MPRKLDLIIVFFFALPLFFGDQYAIVTHLVEIFLLANFFLQVKKYGKEFSILITGIVIIALLISTFTDFSYLIRVYYYLILPLLIFYYGFKVMNIKSIMFLYAILSTFSILLLYFSFQTLEFGYEYKEGYYVSEYSRVYAHFITGKLITGTDAFLYALPIVIFTFLLILTKRNIIQIFILFSAIIYVLSITKTRSGGIFLISLSLCFLIFRYKLNFNKSLIFGLLSAVLLYFTLDLNGYIPERFSFAYNRNVGLNERDILWAFYLFAISANPFGNSGRIEIDYLTYSSHNTILEYFYSLGWIFGLAFLVFYFRSILTFFKFSFGVNYPLEFKVFSLLMLSMFLFLNIESPPESNKYAWYSMCLLSGFYFNYLKKNEV